MPRTFLFGCGAIVILAVIAIPISAAAQQKTVGLFLNSPGSFDGYTLFAPLNYTTTYLINNDGRLIHFWEGDYTPGNSVYFGLSIIVPRRRRPQVIQGETVGRVVISSIAGEIPRSMALGVRVTGSFSFSTMPSGYHPDTREREIFWCSTTEGIVRMGITAPLMR